MGIYLAFVIFYFLFLRFYIPNPLFAFIIFYFLYNLVDRQFVALPKAFRPFKNRGRIKALKDEINLNPANANAYFELGQIYLEQNKHQNSIDCFLQTLSKMGDYAEVFFLLGKAQFLSDEKEKGLLNIQKALEIDDRIGYGEPYIYLLTEEIKNGNNQEGIEALLSMINNFGTPEIFYKAGKIVKSRDKEMAKKLFTMALNSYSGTPKHFKRIHRRWAILAKMQLLF